MHAPNKLILLSMPVKIVFFVVVCLLVVAVVVPYTPPTHTPKA